MASIQLKTVVNPRSEIFRVLQDLQLAFGEPICVADPLGKPLLGKLPLDGASHPGAPVVLNQEILGHVFAQPAIAAGFASMLATFAAGESERRALAAETLHLYREVHLIEQLSEQLAALLDLEAVGDSALAQARRLIPATHGCILVSEQDGSPLRVAAHFGSIDEGQCGPLALDSQFAHSILERGIAEVVNDCGSDPRLQECERSLKAILCAPLRAGHRPVGLIALASTAPHAVYSAGDLKLANTIALQTAAAIENSFLCAQMVGAVRDREHLAALQQELDTARKIQHLLVPRTFPPFPDRPEFELHAQMTSARAVGGDFFDFFLIDENRIGIVIGDVSGKGIPAALYMALTRMQVKTTAIRGVSPAECLLEVNRVLVGEKISAMFATCFYGILNLTTGEFSYCSAGHNHPYLIRPTRETVETLTDVGGIPLGLFDGMGYANSTTQLFPGDTLFLYTDGVPEAQNCSNNDFSDEEVMTTLKANCRLGCSELIDVMTKRVTEFTAGAAQSDDITMLSIRRN